jgi:putative ABC transport system permease protein
MLKNYLITAWRHISKNRLFSAINIFGLAVGMMSCILIALFVRDEMSFDTFWTDADQIYRLHTTFLAPSREPSISVQAPGPAKSLLKQYFSNEISHSTRFTEMSSVVTYGDEVSVEAIHWTDPDTAEIFSLQTIAGDLALALNGKSSLAISERFASRYFGDADALGKVLTVSVRKIRRDYRVAAVFKDLPRNSVLAFEVLAKIDETDFPGRFDGWTSASGSLFFKLKDGTSIAGVTSRLDDFINANVDKGSNTGLAASDLIQFDAMALKDLHLNAVGWGEMKAPGDKAMVMIVSAIAAVILLIAGINFTNLSVALSTRRAREVALRKVAGARQGQLFFQFMGESVMMACVALLLGLVLVDIALPYYNEFLGRDLALNYDLGLLAAAVGLAFTVGLIGGAYPALVVSRYLPGKILKTNTSAEISGSVQLRHLLVVLQFTISITLIVSTVVVYGQLSLMAHTDRGFNQDNLLILEGTRSQGVRDLQSALKEQVLVLPEVLSASYSWRVPGRGGGTSIVELPGAANAGAVGVNVIGLGYDFLDTYEIALVAGRNYSRAYQADGIPSAAGASAGDVLQGTVVVNEQAIARFGYGTPNEAVGKIVRMTVGNTPEGPIKADLRIIGVARDVHFYSLRDEIQPELHQLVKGGAPYLTVRYLGDPVAVTAQLKAVWRQLAPTVPFAVTHAEDLLADDFITLKSFRTVMAAFASLAALVACLGLYGLASFSTSRRIKEIGLRKILGASVVDIVRLLIWQFSKPVLLANLIAWPLATWLMLRWLEGFSYRLDAWILLPLCLASGAIALVVAWLTVGGNAAVAARANPIKALRYE